MDNRHLWLRSHKQVAVMQIRNAIIYATYEFFDRTASWSLIAYPFRKCCRRFYRTFPKQTTLEHQPTWANLVSSILKQVLWLWSRLWLWSSIPCWKSKTRRHLTEFWMMDASTHTDTRRVTWLAKKLMLKALLQGVLDRAPQALKPWNVIRALETLHCWAIQTHHLRSNHWPLARAWKWWRRWLRASWAWGWLWFTTRNLDFKPLWCTNLCDQLPSSHQGLLHETSSWKSRARACADLLAPEGYGEIIGGSMREEDYDALVAKMESLGMDLTGTNSTLTFVNMVQYHTVDLVSVSSVW